MAMAQAQAQTNGKKPRGFGASDAVGQDVQHSGSWLNVKTLWQLALNFNISSTGGTEMAFMWFLEEASHGETGQELGPSKLGGRHVRALP
jgi:hypothetical protein